jgi:hypothetical protein
LNEPLRLDAIVDSGAGHSYLIIDQHYPRLPVDKLPGNGPLVQFADGTQRPIKERESCALTLFSVEGEEFFAPNTELLILRSADGNQILLGRDLIERFRLQICGIEKVTLYGAVMYQKESGKPNCKTKEKFSHPGLAERLSYLKTTVPKRHLETMPSFVIQEDDDTNQFDISDLLNEKTETDPIQVFIGDPDPSAPWGRPHITIPWRSEARPPVNLRSVWARDQITLQRLSAEDARVCPFRLLREYFEENPKGKLSHPRGLLG